MYTVLWSEEAKNSLADIYDYIFEDSPQNALHVFNTLFELANSLSNPKVEYAKDLIINDDRFRVIHKWNYKIVYERKVNEVRILDIFHTRRNPLLLRELKK